MNFFDKTFWQMLVVSVVGQAIVLTVAISVSIVLGDNIEKLTRMFDTLNSTPVAIQQVIEVDPAKVTAMSETIGTAAETIGGDLGDGGASAVSRIGEAFNKLKPKE